MSGKRSQKSGELTLGPWKVDCSTFSFPYSDPSAKNTLSIQEMLWTPQVSYMCPRVLCSRAMLKTWGTLKEYRTLRAVCLFL